MAYPRSVVLLAWQLKEYVDAGVNKASVKAYITEPVQYRVDKVLAVASEISTGESIGFSDRLGRVSFVPPQPI